MSRAIHIRGARTHNLRDVSCEIPRDAWTLVCGPSGSGKSSLALDTLAAESRRRYLGTLRRAAGGAEGLPRPDVDGIDGLPPAVTSGFRGRRPSVRQTLATVADLARGLQVLFSRLGTAHCPICGDALPSLDPAMMREALMGLPEGTRVLVLVTPDTRGGAAREEAMSRGFVRLRRGDGTVQRVEDAAGIPDDERLAWVLDRLVIKRGAKDRVAASIDQALSLGRGRFVASVLGTDEPARDMPLSVTPYCARDDRRGARLTPGLFSFNNPRGACPTCSGRGALPPKDKTSDPPTCPDCDGSRLCDDARAARLDGTTLPDVLNGTLSALVPWLDGLKPAGTLADLCQPILDEIRVRATFLCDVGLGYLAPARAAASLSHGELRRAALAATCAARMSGLLFVLDEPTAGLHPVDRPPLGARLRALVEDDNTLVVVDHDPWLARRADHVIALGPGAGREGGTITLDAGREAHEDGRLATALAWDDAMPALRGTPRSEAPLLAVRGACIRTLRDIDVPLRTQALNVVAGVSGAGKSTLALDVLAPVATALLRGDPVDRRRATTIDGIQAIERVVVGRGRAVRHPRATAGSLLGVLGSIRALYAATLEARARGWGPSWFSTNVAGGRCDTCEGVGERTLRLPDLPATRVPCDVCEGRRFRSEVRAVRWRGLSFPALLDRSLSETAAMFRDVPRAGRALRAACDVGLGYIRLGESSRSLSTGETLRLRLAAALGKGGVGRTLYILDEPATGLHASDVRTLIQALLALSDSGHTVVVVEHDPQVLAQADHVVELGPGPGEAGGEVVYAGPPAGLLDCAHSPTGQWWRNSSTTSP